MNGAESVPEPPPPPASVRRIVIDSEEEGSSNPDSPSKTIPHFVSLIVHLIFSV